jgi:hypothetical protein
MVLKGDKNTAYTYKMADPIKANDENKLYFINAGGEQLSLMPYSSISEETINNQDALILMDDHAIHISK